MATEKLIRTKAREILEKEGFHLWCPSKVRYKETDIFGIYDGLAIKDSELRFIQWTSKSNIRAREKKIHAFFTEHNCFIPCEVWGWDEIKKEFIIIHI